MAKKLDITEKLNFEEQPALIIKGREIKVNNDAKSILKLIGILDDNNGTEIVTKGYGLIFAESEQKKIENLNLSMIDFTTVVKEAIALVINNEGNEEGEQ